MPPKPSCNFFTTSSCSKLITALSLSNFDRVEKITTAYIVPKRPNAENATTGSIIIKVKEIASKIKPELRIFKIGKIAKLVLWKVLFTIVEMNSLLFLAT